jgi:hypothetical protein
VDNIGRFQDPRYPGVPLFNVPDLSWDFEGKNRKAGKKAAPPAEVRRCPYNAYMICELSIRCPQCERYAPGDDGVPVIESIPLQERRAEAVAPHIITAAEKREAQDGVIRYTEIVRTAGDDDEAYDKAVAGLVKTAERLDYHFLKAYHWVNKNKTVIDIRLLHSIARAKGYKPGVVHYWQKQLRAQMEGAAV